MSKRLTVELNIKEGTAADFEAAAGPAIARVQAEDSGCEQYELFRNIADDTKYVMVEAWASQEELDAHGKSDAMKAMAAIGPFLAGGPKMHRYED